MRTDGFVQRFLAFLPPYSRCDRRILVLAAYLDESGREEKGIYAVAGYVFDAKGAGQFEQRWRWALSSTRPPLDRFHMKEFAPGTGQFAGWKEPYRRQFLNRLASIIHSTARLQVSVVLDLEAFGKMAPDIRDAANQAGQLGLELTPYSMCYQVCIGEIRVWLEQAGYTGTVNYVLDQIGRGKGKGYLEQSFRTMAKDPAEVEAFRVGNQVWADSRCALHLQAADWLVWEMSRLGVWHAGKDDRGVRESLKLLLRGTTGANRRSWFLTDDWLSALVANLRSNGGVVSTSRVSELVRAYAACTPLSVGPAPGG